MDYWFNDEYYCASCMSSFIKKVCIDIANSHKALCTILDNKNPHPFI